MLSVIAPEKRGNHHDYRSRRAKITSIPMSLHFLYIYIYIYTVRPVEIVPRGGPIFYLYIQRGKKVDQILGNFYYAF